MVMVSLMSVLVLATSTDMEECQAGSNCAVKGSALLQMETHQNGEGRVVHEIQESDELDDEDEYFSGGYRKSTDQPGCDECNGPKMCWYPRARAKGNPGKGCNPDIGECEPMVGKPSTVKWHAKGCNAMTSCKTCSMHNGTTKQISWGNPKYTPQDFCADCSLNKAPADC